MKKFQIKTHGNGNLARVIQEKLFELGCGWHHGGNTVKILDAHSYQIGFFEDGDITKSDGDSYGLDICPLITLDELFAMSPEKKETIKIGGQTYDKALFEEATKNLKPIK